MNGFVDKLTTSEIIGWSEGDVEAVVDRRFVITPSRVISRSDLETAGIVGSGFEFDIEKLLPGYVAAEIIVRPKGSVTPLQGGYLKIGEIRSHQYVESNAEARAHHERLMSSAVRGVCLFTSRSGGTYLADRMRAHPSAYAVAEPLDGFSGGGRAGFYRWLDDYFTIPGMTEYHKVVQDPKLVFITSKIKKYDHELIHAFNYYDVKYLRLYRENVLRQALSYLVARQLYAASSNFNINASELSGGKVSRRKIFVDPAYLVHLVESYQDVEKEIDDLVSTEVAGDVFSISYEQLTGSEAAVASVFEYFGLPHFEAVSSHQKINSGDMSKQIENYEEVWKFVRRTRFAHWLS
ncbi:hypothetical protein [Paraburkholderia tropica]|uniref:hypothetical protein n=1 Tax=Paraburkholderia tropica TaxID=92647 RepID=UPI002AB66ADD|nr:hypothetical protein [Paraburkholderia tropica]